MHVCTIVARNYLAQARVLGRSLKAANPDATLWVLVVDGVHDGLHEPFALVDPQELDLGADLAVMRLIYDVTELSTAVKPALLRALLRAHRRSGDLPRSRHRGVRLAGRDRHPGRHATGSC